MGSINSRIFEFQKFKKLSDPELCAILKYESVTELSRMRNGKEATKAFLNKLEAYFPTLNMEWILNGSGTMEIMVFNESPVEYKPIKKINHDPHGRDIPVIDTEVYASIVSVLSASITLPPDTFIRIPIFSEGEAISIKGTG